MATPFETYLKSVASDYRRGNATEYTYRTALETYMETIRGGIDASSDPKHIACGAPDFIIERRRVPLGYVETKDIGDDLSKTIKTPQLKRYLKALNNLILTDYLEFRWYLNGQLKRAVRVAEMDKKNRLIVGETAENDLGYLFKDFFATVAPTVTTPKELATRLAGVTHFIKQQIVAAFDSPDQSVKAGLEQRLNAFQIQLLPSLTHSEFADLYSQTMTYGLFAAKLAAQDSAPTEGFNLQSAYYFLGSNKFLRRLFLDVSEELDEVEIIRPYLEDIVSLLNRASFDEILTDFGKRTRTTDPVVHFYETFLAAYDPKLREKRGVYYTPEPVVQFIVRSIHEILKTDFDKPWGLADRTVKVLDPATGTGTFLYFVIHQVHEEVTERRQQAGQWPEISKDLLRRLFGFELLMAPYVISHLKLALELKILGVPLEGKEDRIGVFLTNTLEEGTSKEDVLGFGNYIAEESNEASKVKRDKDVMVVLGNPPYSKLSSNRGQYINDLLHLYTKDLPNERNIQPLHDDYIKFIRWSQERIMMHGCGVIGMITNHSYLSRLIHRGMRKELLNTFDHIYIINLHGNTNYRETTPEGGKDENVFDIKQGVSIGLFVKVPTDNVTKRVYYTDVWGKRNEKYNFLVNNELRNIRWQELSPMQPSFYFVPKENTYEEEYNKYPKIDEIFQIYTSGIKTHRDHFAVAFERQALVDRITELTNPSIPDSEIRRIYDLPDKGVWKLSNAREKLRNSQDKTGQYQKYLYRPFDSREIIYNNCIVERSREKVMKNLLFTGNIALIVDRSTSPEVKFNHVFITETLTDVRTLPDFGGAPFIFPLYTYFSWGEADGHDIASNPIHRDININHDFIKNLEEKIKVNYCEVTEPENRSTFSPDQIFGYIYAILHSKIYRERYSELLESDFPRIPITSQSTLFFTLSDLGRQLIDLHLLRSPIVNKYLTTFPKSGNNLVDKMTCFQLETGNLILGSVKINSSQYFGGIPKEVWEFEIGGYQFCQKWLKDRKGRVLSAEEINHYQKAIVAINETIRLMEEIDYSIPGWPII